MASEGTESPPQRRASPGEHLIGCLQILGRYYGKAVSPHQVIGGLPIGEHGLSVERFPPAAKNLGFSADRFQRSLADIPCAVLPCVLITQNGVVVFQSRTEQGQATIVDPHVGEMNVDMAQLSSMYTGDCFLIKTHFEFDDSDDEKLEITLDRHWFTRTLWISRGIYRDVLMATLLINFFALVSPLFVMNVSDRVVPNNALDTLWTLAIAAFLVFTFDFVFKALRTYFLDIAGKKSDLMLSSTIFDHVARIKMSHRPQSTGSFAKNLSDFESVR